MDNSYKDAIKSLYDEPRAFISKKMRAFELETNSTALEQLPSTFVFPNDLKNRIYYDVAKKELCFIGVMTESERSMLKEVTNSSSDLSDTARD